MAATLDDFRRHFSSLSDEALMAVKTADLVDAARDCHTAEMNSRGLKPKAAAEPRMAADSGDGGSCCGPEGPSEEYVTLTTFPTHAEAEMVVELLAEEKIPARIAAEGAFEAQVLVPVNYLDRAEIALNTGISDEELEAQAAAAAEESPE